MKKIILLLVLVSTAVYGAVVYYGDGEAVFLEDRLKFEKSGTTIDTNVSTGVTQITSPTFSIFRVLDQFGTSLSMAGNTLWAESGGGDASMILQHQPGGTVIESDGTNSTTLGRNDNDTNIMNDGSFELSDGELTCSGCTLSVIPAFSPTFKNRYAIRASFSASTGKVCYTKTSSSYQGHKLSAAITVVNSASNGIYFRAQRNGAAITGIEQHVKVSATPERYVLPQFIGGNTSLGWCIEATEAITADIDFDNAFIGAGEAEVIRDYFDVVETKYLSADVSTAGVVSDLTFSNLTIGDWYEVKLNILGSANATDGRFAVLIMNGSDALAPFQFYQSTSSGNIAAGTSRVFKATSDTLTFVYSENATAKLDGNGTPAETHAQLIHKKSGSYINSTTTQQAGEIYFNGNDSCRPGDVGFGEEISRTDYPELFAKWGERFGEGDGSTTFMTPPRGYFLRVADLGAGNDPDAASRVACDTGGVTGDAVGSCQDDAFQGHWHTYNHNQNDGGYAPAGNNMSWNDTRPFSFTNNTMVRGAISDGVNGTPRISSETRSKNIAMRGCIVARTARVVAELTETVKYDGSEMLDRERIDNGDGTFSQVYKRCYKVASDISSTTTIDTIDTGLNIIDGVLLVDRYRIVTGTRIVSSTDSVEVDYNQSTGALRYLVNNQTVKAGTSFCFRYYK